MEIKKINVLTFNNEEEKALATIYEMFDIACDMREDEKGCHDCPLEKNCPLCNGNRVEAMKNFIKKIVG